MVAPEMIFTYIIQKSLQVKMNLLLRSTSIGIQISSLQSGSLTSVVSIEWFVQHRWFQALGWAHSLFFSISRWKAQT